jgi:signal transduction histidine kinase/CheY-like chemotaxis protein
LAVSALDQLIRELGGLSSHANPLNTVLESLNRVLGATQTSLLRPTGTTGFIQETTVSAAPGSRPAVALAPLYSAFDAAYPSEEYSAWDVTAPLPVGPLTEVCQNLHASTGASTVFALRLPPAAPAPGGLLVILLEPGQRDSSLTLTLARIAALQIAGQLARLQHAHAQVDAESRYRAIVAAGATSDYLFREVLRYTDDAVFFLRVEPGPRFVYELVNERFTEVTGLQPGNVIDCSAQQLYPPSAANRFERDYLECYTSGAAATREQHVILGPGVFVFRTTLIPLRDSEGAINRLIGFATDVTDLRQQQTLLAESEAVARTGGWDLDCTTDTLRWTPGTHLIFDTAPASFVPTLDSAIAFYTDDCRSAVVFAIKSARQTGADFDFTATARTASGRLISLRALGQTESVDGRVVRILGAIVDISAHEEAEKERLRLEAQLRRAQKMEAIGTLAGGIAHDFNNILAGIMGNVQLAASELNEATPAHRFLDRAFQSCLRARDLVRRMLTFSRQVEQTHTSTALIPLVEEAVALLRASLPANIVIQTTYPEDQLNILADAGQIHQIILNLATNAAHAMSPSGGTLTLELAPTTPDDIWHRRHPQVDLTHSVRFSVRDTGCGMGQDTVERIFEPFFTTKSFGEGSGLGLAMVHGILESHGGSIVVESVLGQGSAFHLFFPAPVRTIAPAATNASIARPSVAVGRGQHILVVDDEASITALVGPVLHHLGYHARVCQSPEEALAAFNAAPGEFDALLTDFSMPGMNGLELAAAIREFRPDLPVVIMTGFLRTHDLAPLRDSGVHHLINKPFTMDILATKFAEVFRGHAVLN